jgi:hypothetical protein
MKPDLTAIKIEELRSDTAPKAKLPDLPVSIVLQEAMNLYDWCRNDKEKLVKAGLDWKLAEDLPVRAAALSSLETTWTSERNTTKDCQKEWKAALPLALTMRNELVRHLFFAFRLKPNAYAKVQRIAKGHGHEDMIQDLIELSTVGRKHQTELERVGIDLSILDKAWKASFDLGDLLARVNGVVHESSKSQELRNKAYYHLKEAIEEVRLVGQYVFWNDEERRRGYMSAFLHRKNLKIKHKHDKPAK